MGKKKDAAADAASSGPFMLGPQDDGSIVVRLPDDFHLMVMRKALEKQEKNSTAAEGTISALAEGEDPFLDRVQRTLAKLKAIITNARAPENQVADTPIGKEIERNKAEAAKGEQIDGQPDGVTWAPHVPKPRPRLGNSIRYPSGEAVGIAHIIGFDDKDASFVVKGADDMQYAVIGHDTGTETEWRISGESAYKTPRVEPKPMTPGDELVAAVEGDDRLLADAPSGSADDDGEAAAGSSEPTKGKPAAKKAAGRKPTAQQQRNARNAGVKPLPNAVPKPSAAKKGGKGRGAR